MDMENETLIVPILDSNNNKILILTPDLYDKLKLIVDRYNAGRKQARMCARKKLDEKHKKKIEENPNIIIAPRFERPVNVIRLL